MSDVTEANHAVLKRFMTWLLHQFQKVLGMFSGNRSRTDVSAPTKFGDKAAARLQQSQILNLDDSVAKRVSIAEHPSDQLAKAPLPDPSVAPIQPEEEASDLNNAGSPAPTEPDTHRRLDAAPAARPGGEPTTPSFPTDVSELISSQSVLAPTLRSDANDDLSVPDVEVSADEQLPAIHDLLPAIEQNDSDAILLDSTQSELSLSESALDDKDIRKDENRADENRVNDAPIVEAAERVDANSEKATLFSFDITEVDASVETDTTDTDYKKTAAEPSVPTKDSEEVAYNSAKTLPADVLQTSADDEQPIISRDNSALDLPTEKLEPSPSVAEGPSSIALSSTDNSIRTKTDKTNNINPWLTASPPAAQTSATEALSTKQGLVKLLFTLKPGNFHGYIAPEDGSKDILFHQKYINAEIFDELEKGTRVVATVKMMEGKAYATHVDLLQE